MNIQDIQHVSSEPGELILVRTDALVVMVDQASSAPEAINALVGAATLGDHASLTALVTGPEPQFGSFAMLVRTDTGWNAHVSGELGCTVECPTAMTVTAPKPGELHTQSLDGCVKVALHDPSLGPHALAPGTELAPGINRAGSVVIGFEPMAAAAPAPVTAPTPPVESAAVVAPPPVAPDPEPAAAEPVPAAPPAAAPVPQASTPPPPTGLPVSTAPAPPPLPPEVAVVDLSEPVAQPRPALAVNGTDSESSTPSQPSSDAAEANPEREPVQVLGVRCPVDHHNHPNAVYCAQCGRRMGVNQTIVARNGPRPPLGLFLFADGTSFPIASDIIIGRDPSAHTDVADQGAEMLRLADERSEISRSHAGVYLDNWSVTVVDLNSSNGTRLRRKDTTDWVRVGADKPAVLEAGDTVGIGEHELRLELHHVHSG